MRRKVCEADTRHGYLILASPDCALKAGAEPKTVRQIDSGHPDIVMEEHAARMLTAALADIGSGERIVPVSGYRPHEEQVHIWDGTMQKEGEAYTRTYVAKPGHSEHESGLAIDLAENSKKIDFICPDFPYDGICGQFRAVAAHYGFIERYPAGREHITGIGAEPWHFRYVGCPHALTMKREGLVLEEYLRFLHEETATGRPYDFIWENMHVETFYVSLQGHEEAVIETEDGVPFTVSGTNEGGIVVSQWKVYDA